MLPRRPLIENRLKNDRCLLVTGGDAVSTLAPMPVELDSPSDTPAVDVDIVAADDSAL